MCVCVCVDVFFRREEGRFVAESHTSSVLERPERGAPYRAKRPRFAKEETSGCERAAPFLNRLEHARVGGRGEPPSRTELRSERALCSACPRYSHSRGDHRPLARACAVSDVGGVGIKQRRLLGPEYMAARGTWEDLQRMMVKVEKHCGR